MARNGKRRHARKRRSGNDAKGHVKHSAKERRSKAEKLILILKAGKIFVGILGIIASVVGIWQFAIVDPELRALDIGSDPFEVIVTLRNSLWVTMYDTQVASVSGPIETRTDVLRPEFTEDLKPLSSEGYPCQRLLKDRDLKLEAGKNLLIREKNVGSIDIGHEITYTTGEKVVGSVRGIVGIAVSYRPGILGIELPWRRYTCREFQIVVGSDMHHHPIPFN